MPFDDRPVGEGGNRGMNQPEKDGGFSSFAPKGKFRVVGVDTFDGGDWVEGDCDTLEEAIELANKTGGTMLKTHVYDDKGKSLYHAGTF